LTQPTLTGVSSDSKRVRSALRRFGTSLARLAPAGTFRRDAATLSLGTLLGQAVPVVALPVISRLYSPEDYGVLAAYSAILGFIGVVANLRFDEAVPLPSDRAIALSVLVAGLASTLLVTALSAVTLLPYADRVANWAGAPQLEGLMWLVPLGVLIIGVYGVLSRWTIRLNQFGLLSRTKVAQGIGSAVTQVGLGMARAGAVGLILGTVVGQGVGSSWLARAGFERADLARSRAGGVRAIWKAALRYKKFPLVSTWGALLNAVSTALPPLLISSLHGSQVAGWFGMTVRIAGAPTALVGGAVAMVYFGRGATIASSSPEQFMALFKSATKKMALAGLVVFLPLGAAAPWLLPLVLGQRWGPAGLYTAVLTPMYYAAFVSSTLGFTLAIAERQGLFVLREVVRSALMASFYLLARFLALSPLATVCLLSVTGCLGYGVYYLVSRHAVRQFSDAHGKCQRHSTE